MPAIQEFDALLELRLLPMRLATKTGEIWRQGACANKFLSVDFCPPAFTAVPEAASKEHFTDLFGLKNLFTGCSDMARVKYRGNDIDAAAAVSCDHFVSTKLMLLHRCEPALVKELPIGFRPKSNQFLVPSIVHTNYPLIRHYRDGVRDDVCLYLTCCLLEYNSMFFHTQKRGGRDAGVQRCPTT